MTRAKEREMHILFTVGMDSPRKSRMSKSSYTQLSRRTAKCHRHCHLPENPSYSFFSLLFSFIPLVSLQPILFRT